MATARTRAAAPKIETKPETESKEVAVQKGGALAHADALPGFMAGYGGQGIEALGSADIEVPRIKLLQATSPELEEFEEARPGHFWHVMAEKSLGPKLDIVPVYVDIRAILWRPRHDGGGILARTDDMLHWSPSNASFDVKLYKDNDKRATWRTGKSVAQSGLLEWGSYDPTDNASAPAATKMYNMVVGLPNFPDLPPAVVTLQRSAIRVARKFMGRLKMSRAPSYGTVFTMESVKEENKAGDAFKNFKFTPNGFVADEDMFNSFRDLYLAFKQSGLNIADLEGLAGDGEEIVQAGAGDDAGTDGRPDY